MNDSFGKFSSDHSEIEKDVDYESGPENQFSKKGSGKSKDAWTSRVRHKIPSNDDLDK